MVEQIISVRWDGVKCGLIRTDGSPVLYGDILESSKGEQRMAIVGGRAPHKPGSTGRVWVRPPRTDDMSQEYFPSVFNLHWEEL